MRLNKFFRKSAPCRRDKCSLQQILLLHQFNQSINHWFIKQLTNRNRLIPYTIKDIKAVRKVNKTIKHTKSSHNCIHWLSLEVELTAYYYYYISIALLTSNNKMCFYCISACIGSSQAASQSPCLMPSRVPLHLNPLGMKVCRYN